jgi:hypothetical protein
MTKTNVKFYKVQVGGKWSYHCAIKEYRMRQNL